MNDCALQKYGSVNETLCVNRVKNMEVEGEFEESEKLGGENAMFSRVWERSPIVLDRI